MNEELEKTANEALRGFIENAASAKEFVLAELPEVVEQLLMWKMAESLAYCLFSFVLCLIPALLLRWQWKNRDQHREWVTKCEMGEGIYGINVLCLFPIMIAPMLWDLTWLQIWIAPKVYLLEYAASLVK